MKPIYLFESGGTKTSLLIDERGEVKEFLLPGYNPNRSDTSLESVLKDLKIHSDAIVYYYGSGLSDEKHASHVSAVFERLYGVKAYVYGDLLGAARALYGTHIGVIAIMGTGGIAAYYDGQKIVRRSGGWGYLIDDLGGGYELGKVVVVAWLSGRLSVPFSADIEAYLGIKKEDFIPDYYAHPDVSTIAGLSEVTGKHKNDPFVHRLIYDYFMNFFDRHLLWLCREYNAQQVGLVGSIAYHFSDIIASVANDSNIRILNILGRPGEELLKFHRKQAEL